MIDHRRATYKLERAHRSRNGRGCRPSVCFVSPSRATAELLSGRKGTDVGGAEVQVTHLAGLLARRAWEVSCIVADAGERLDSVNSDGVRVIQSYRPLSRAWSVGWLTHKWPRLWDAMRRADADIYITRGANWLAGAAALFGRRHGRLSVFWMASRQDALNYGTQSRLPVHVRACYRYGVRHADAIIAQTEEQRALMIQAANRHAIVIPNTWIPSNGDLSSLVLDDVGVLWVGNIRPRKRPEVALEVAELLPELPFTIIGGPVPGSEELYEGIVQRGNELGNVRCLGHVPHDEVHRYYAGATALLHTSEMEGFPNVFLEAWGHGLPVVSTFDPDGVIHRHRLGAICSTKARLASELRALTNDPVRCQATATRAINYVQRIHSPTAVASAVEDLLSRLGSSTPGSGGASPE